MKKPLTALILAAILFIATAGFYFFFYSAIRASQEDVARLEEGMREAQARERLNRTLEILVRDTEKERATLAQHFVSADGVVGFIEYLEGLGRRAGATVKVGAIDVGESFLATRLDHLTLTISASGSFASVARFVSLLETLPYISVIDEMSLEKRAAAKNTWDANVTVSAAKTPAQKP